MSGRRYHMMEIVGEPLLIPVLVADEGPAPNLSPLFRKGEPMPDLPAPPPVPKCPQCGGPIVTPVPRKIFYRDRDPRTGKAKVCEMTPDFCSEQCGLHNQYSHEG